MKIATLSCVASALFLVSACAPVAPVQPATVTAPAAPPESEIFMADLDLQNSRVGPPRNISRHKGYDNQPAFAPQGRAVWFVSDRNGGMDVYRYDMSTEQVTQVTATTESEFSPTPLPQGAGFSATHVKQPSAKGDVYTDSQQLWRYGMDGKPAAPLLDMGRIGYHAWLDANRVALFIVGNEARKVDHSLLLANLTTGQSSTLAMRIGRSLGRTPDGQRISFVDKRDPANWTIAAIGPGETQAVALVATPRGPAGEPDGARSEDYVWLPDGGLMMAKDNRLLRWSGKPGTEFVEFARIPDLDGAIKRLAVSADGKRIAFVVQR